MVSIIVDIDDFYSMDTKTGEKLRRQNIYLRDGQIARAFDPAKIKNIKHVKLRTAVKQKSTLKSLGRDEKSLLFTMLLYMDWETGIVVGDGVVAAKDVPLKWKDIDEVSGICRSLRKLAARELERKRVVGYMVVGKKRVGIVINPEYAIYGKNPAKALLQVFKCDESVMDEDE